MTTFGELEIGDEFIAILPGLGQIRGKKISARKAKYFDVNRGIFKEISIPYVTIVMKV